MSLKIEIPDNQLNSLKQYYIQVYENFKIKSQPIIDEWNEINPILKQLGILTEDLLEKKVHTKTAPLQSLQKIDGYDKKWGWLTKIEYIIEKKGRPLTTKEIINQLQEVYEPDIDIKKAGNSVPATLSSATKDGKINRTKKEKGDYVYSLINKKAI